MAPKPVDAGKSFLEQVLAKIPESDRPALTPHIQALIAAEPVLAEIGNGALRQDEFSRGMANVQAELTRLKGVEAQQTEWYNANKDALEKARQAPASGDPALEDDPARRTAAPVPGMTLADVTKLINEREAGVVPFVGATTRLAIRHLQTFGEVLDTEAVVREAASKGLTLEAAYETQFKDQLATKRKEAEDAAFDKRYRERQALEQKDARNRPPDAVGGVGSPLDVLDPKPGTGGATVDELVDEYNRLIATQS